MNHHDPDDLPDDLEARLHAWRPAALPPALHARLLAAEPRPRRPAARSLLSAAGALAAALAVGWWLGGQTPSGETLDGRRAARGVPEAGRFADVAWTPGANLTMDLATGNLPAPWRLDGDPGVGTGLFALPSDDGKLLLKVDCQF